MLKSLVAAVVLTASTVAAAQECKDVPSSLPLLAKRSQSDTRGGQVDVNEIKIDGTKMTGKITLYGPGPDGCTIRNHSVVGTCEAGVMKFAAVIAPDDLRTCKAEYTLYQDKNWSGTYHAGFVSRR